ncbi:MAG: hypothetical protein EOM11_07445, partial [Erysipelotrichia bacterium]|nr:hypothetical protein [Erysipelotrichia bacterium]
MSKYRVQEGVACSLVEQKVKLFDNGLIEIRKYKSPILKIKQGYEKEDFVDCESVNSKGRQSSQLFDDEIENKKVSSSSLARSISLLHDYANANESEWLTFITLTFAENIIDINLANKKFNCFVKCMRRSFPDFKYLGVPEFQKRGAVHYHLLTNLVKGSELLPLQKGTNDKYDVKYWSYGFSSVFDLKNTDDNFNVVAYICKYFYKDFDNRLFGRTKILKSNNLKKPLVYEYERNDFNNNLANSFIESKDLEYTEKE